jgi:type I restriction enzyme M protein
MNKQELAAKIWESANALRKNIKASEYKDYIIGFMFYKYLSDKEIDYIKDNGGTEEDLMNIDEDSLAMISDQLGYFIRYEDLFSSWKKMDLKLGAKTVSDAIEQFYKNLNKRYARCFYVYHKEVDEHSGVFDALDAGLSKLGENAGSRDKAVRDIVDLVNQIPPKSKDYDVLGYVYEYLIQQFSSEAKKDGAFYTPHGLTTLMARIVAQRIGSRKDIKVYDPCVGTAGLLLNIGKEVGKYSDETHIKYYGQELITETSNLAKMNLFMQDVPVQNIIIRNANTLEEDWPYFDESTEYSPLFVDACVLNPPYSAHWDPDQYATDERFRNYGLAPNTKADLAFLLHGLYHLKPDGVMAIVMPHGVLFRGGSEAEIRKNLIENHNIETIIGFPSNLFFATPIPVTVIVLSKNRAESDVLFIDASESYQKGKKQNVLRESDVQKIYDAVVARKDIPHFAKLVSMDEIVRQDYNLNISRYVSAKQEETPYDLFSVMSGKIVDTEIDQYSEAWGRFPKLREKIFTSSNGYSVVSCDDIKTTVFEDEDVKAFLADQKEKGETFHGYLVDTLIDSEADKSAYYQISEKLFSVYGNDSLIDKYDVYQTFAENWDTIEGDLARIASEGKDVCRQIEENKISKKNPKTKKYEDVVVGMKGKVIHLDLIKSTFFKDDFDKMNELQAQATEADNAIEESLDSLEDDVKNDITKDDDETKIVEKKLKAAIKSGEYDKDVIDVLQSIKENSTKKKDCNKQIKMVDKALEQKAEEKAQAVSDDEIRELLIMKWIDPIVTDIDAVADQVVAGFVSSLKELYKKYSDPLSDLTAREEETKKELKDMMGHLIGSDTDMKAVQMFMEEL